MKNLNYFALAALLAAAGCGGKAPAETAGAAENAGAIPDSVEISTQAQLESGITVETLRRASVPETFQAMGRVMQDAQKPRHIMAGGAGTLVSVAAVLGQAVKTGDELAIIKTASGEELKVPASGKGIVTAVHAGEGDQVNEMTFLFTITEVDPLWGVLDIPERSLAAVKPGQKADIKTAAYPRETFKGDIVFVSPEIDNVSRTVKARVSIANPAGLLKFGMFLDATVRTGAYFQGLAVPDGAVQNGPSGPFVFVRTGKTEFRPRPVETGREKDGLTEITRGLKPGESVVTANAYLLKSEMMKSQMGED